MKCLLSVSALSATLLLFGSAMPGLAANVLFEDLDTSGGDITANAPFSTSDPLFGSTAILNDPFDTLVVSGAPMDNGTYGFGGMGGLLFLEENFDANTDVLTLSGAISALSILQETLVTIQFGGDLTANTTLGNPPDSNASLNSPPPPTVTSVVLASDLAADLGITGSQLFLNQLTALGANQGDIENYVVIAPCGDPSAANPCATIGLTTTDSAPEPATGLFAMLGLALIVFLARRAVPLGYAASRILPI